MLGFMSS